MKKRGTAAMDHETVKRISTLGGLTISQDKRHMSKIGKKGGTSISRDREHMRRISRLADSARPRKLSHKHILEIRKRYTEGETQKELAEAYSVSQSHICNIVNGRARTALTEPAGEGEKS